MKSITGAIYFLAAWIPADLRAVGNCERRAEERLEARSEGSED